MHAVLLIGLLGTWTAVGDFQDTPTQTPANATKADTTQEKQPNDKSKTAPKEEIKTEPPSPQTLLTEFGWANWSLVGSPRKFRQYATPPKGWFLRDLRYSPLFPNTDALVVLKSVGQPDFSADARLARAYGGTIFEGTLTRNRFFELTTDEVDESERTVGKFSLRQSVARDFAVSVKYRKDQELQFFEAGREPENQHITYQDVTAAGRVGSGYLNLSLSNWYYKDNFQAFPDTTIKSVNVGYLWEVKPTISLETSLSRLWLQQADTAKSKVDTIAINGDFSLSPLTDIEIQWRTRHLDMPNVQSAWVREQRIGSLKLAHKWRGWTGQISFKAQKVDRFRGDQSDIDTPSWHTWEGKLSGRLNRNLRMTLRGSQQVLSDQPTMITEVPSSLYWTQRDLLQFKLDGGGIDSNGYLTYSYRHWRNGARRVDLATDELTMGADWQALPSLSLFSELSYELWSGSTSVAREPTFSLFLPDTRLIVIGVNWTVNRRAFVSFSYSDAITLNANPLALPSGSTHGKYFTITGRYSLPNKCEFGLTVAPWRYSDTVTSDLSFNSAIVLLTATARF